MSHYQDYNINWIKCVLNGLVAPSYHDSLIRSRFKLGIWDLKIKIFLISTLSDLYPMVTNVLNVEMQEICDRTKFKSALKTMSHYQKIELEIDS